MHAIAHKQLNIQGRQQRHSSGWAAPAMPAMPAMPYCQQCQQRQQCQRPIARHAHTQRPGVSNTTQLSDTAQSNNSETQLSSAQLSPYSVGQVAHQSVRHSSQCCPPQRPARNSWLMLAGGRPRQAGVQCQGSRTQESRSRASRRCHTCSAAQVRSPQHEAGMPRAWHTPVRVSGLGGACGKWKKAQQKASSIGKGQSSRCSGPAQG